MEKMDKANSKVERLEKKISAFWKEENYIEICNLAEETLDEVQASYGTYGENQRFYAAKICAYVMVSAIMISEGTVIDIIENKKNESCVTCIFENEEICQWTLQALQILNMDYVRCAYIKRIVPDRYADQFDFDKFDFESTDYNEINLLTQEIEERKNAEWNVFLERCQEVGMLDLKSVVLDFPKEFFEGETRNGFYIEPLMKHAWAANIEVLHKVDMLCQTLHIPYFVDWGTLLGTIRHKGYIPWDDDIDIGVLREDYDKLKYAIQHCQNELEFYDVYEEADWGAHASKIVNSLTVLTDRFDLKRYHGFPFPSSVDVFVIDAVPRDKKLEKEQYDALKVISEIVHLREQMKSYAPDGNEYYYAKKNEKNLLETICGMCHVDFSQEEPTNQELFILKDEILNLYSKEQADFYTVPHRLANGQDYYIPKEVFDGRIRMPFENIEVSVPSGYEFILTKNYGDNYMTPINRGGGHGYPFYGIFLDSLQEKRQDKTREDTLRYIERVASGYYARFLAQENTPTYEYCSDDFCADMVDGCMVSEETKRNRAAEMEILAEIQRICDKKKIKYFAVGDTILGAAHKAGYLAQAEGIHLGMLRKDYVEFMNCLGQELDTWFTFQSIYMNEQYTDIRSLIMTDAYLVTDADYMERFHGCREIVGIDITPVDMVDPDEIMDQTRLDIINAMLRTMAIVPCMPPYDEDTLSLVDEWTKQLNIEISKEGNLQRNFVRAIDTVASGYNEQGEKVRITSDLQIGKNTVYTREWFDDTIELPFEKGTIAVPKGYLEIIGE